MNQYPEKVYVNGKILGYQDANISVFDRGFLFGDGIYEVMIQMGGNFFYGPQHLNRLSNCLQKINIDFDIGSLARKIDDLLNASSLKGRDCLLYIQVTRGIAPRKHSFPENTKPTLMMYAKPFRLADINQSHVKVITKQDQRWHNCDIKTTSLLGNVMANDIAVHQGAYESIFVRNGSITEASHCNVFFVKDAMVYTHPANEFILDGITRRIVIKLCEDLEIECKEEALQKEHISTMDEAFLTGTSTQIASIKQIDTHFFYKNEDPGPVTKKLQEAFLEIKRKFMQDASKISF